MRKAFNTESSGVLDIKPMEEIVPEGLPSPPSKSFKHEEVFVNKKVGKSRMELIQEAEQLEPVIEDEESIIEDPEPEPVKRGRGKRGKDKKKRVKKPPTEKQLAHLARIRELSKQRREATKLEKARIKLEIKNKAKENTKKDATIINRTAKKRPTKVIQDTPTPIKNQNNINPTNIRQAPSMEQFFTMMDMYEDYKVKKNAVKKAVPKPQSLPAGRKIQKKYKPDPIIDHNPLRNEPPNPFDICFSYGKRY